MKKVSNLWEKENSEDIMGTFTFIQTNVWWFKLTFGCQLMMLTIQPVLQALKSRVKAQTVSMRYLKNNKNTCIYKKQLLRKFPLAKLSLKQF